MKDEEKAEKYVMREDVDTMKYSECYGERVFFEKEIKRAYLDGLTEGRKEATEENFKEAYQKYVNNSLATFDMKKALEDARDQIRIVKENEQLKQQIEKMKCCGNCKKQNTCIKYNNFIYPEMTNPKNYGCNNLDKWELAE